VHRNVGLSNDVLIFFPGKEVKRVRFVFHELALFFAEAFVDLLDFTHLHVFANTPGAVPAVSNGDIIHNPSAADFTIGALDEAMLVDPRVAGKRGNEADVRTFRGLDGTDATVVRGMDVADLKSSSLPRKAAGPQGRQAPLVSDFRQGVRLVHELGELRRTEELPNGRHDRLGVDQVMGHGGGHFLINRHLLLDCPFHTDQTQAELVLQQFAHGTHAPVPQVVDVVHGVIPAQVLVQLEEITDSSVEVFRLEGSLVERKLNGSVLRMLRGHRPFAGPNYLRADIPFSLANEHLLLVNDHVEIGGGEIARVFQFKFGGLLVDPVLEFGEVTQLYVELQTAHAREIVLARVKEHAV